jgi:hypothetical protein
LYQRGPVLGISVRTLAEGTNYFSNTRFEKPHQFHPINTALLAFLEIQLFPKVEFVRLEGTSDRVHEDLVDRGLGDDAERAAQGFQFEAKVSLGSDGFSRPKPGRNK